MKQQQITLTVLLTAISLTSPAIAMEYDNSPLLLTMPNEILQTILLKNINTTTSLEDGIKTALQLSKTCTRFNVLLTPKAVGQACRHYSQNEKNATLEKLLRTINNITYWNNRRAASMLIYAGANHNIYNHYCPMLAGAVDCNDNIMIAALLENGVKPNQTIMTVPIFFRIRTVAIAKVFRDQGVNVYAKHLPSYPNVLWYIISYNWAPQIMPFYLQSGVNAKELDSYNNNCLLHKLVSDIRFIDNKKQLAELLLNAAPEMVNTLNINGQTPTDMAIASREGYKKMNCEVSQEFLDVIALFEKHGGKTAQQLKNQQSMAREKEAVGDCIICFENNDNMMAIPCPNRHADRICLTCYNSSVQFSENCPLCRTPLQ